MFMLSVRLSPKRMFIGALALTLVISAGVIFSNYMSAKDDIVQATKPAAEEIKETKAAETEKTTAKKTEKTEAEKKIQKKAAAKTNEQRIEFVESYGWEVEAEAAEIIEVIIPKEFDEVYSEYNSIQKMQGCDLTSFSGKRCKRYSYNILNYPGQPENVRINLLVYNNKIIGGDVSSLSAGGFTHGFNAE